MKKTLCLVLCLAFFFVCGPKLKKEERIVEDGVEVVVNQLEPSKIKDEPCSLVLDEKYVIDFEKLKRLEVSINII